MAELDLSPLPFKDIRYLILPRSFARGYARSQLFNQIFFYWFESWVAVLKENQVNLLQDCQQSFFSADAIGALICEEEIVGVNLYTFFNLEQKCLFFHPYFAGHHGD